MSRKPVFVTEPYLPPLEEFLPFLEKMWASKTLTNAGPFHQQLEAALCEHLEVDHISLFANGTLALIAALRAADVSGDVITTPYSFAATAHALVWTGCNPVFVDIDPHTFNLDPAKIESAITPATTAILPVHCYGNPCDVDAIQKIADAHGLQIVYDAAHAFGVRDSEGGILRHGDFSALSFHATKVFNTFEGGAVVSPNADAKLFIDRWKNFGIADEETVVTTGINGKLSEFNSALGLLQLDYIDGAIAERSRIAAAYRERLDGVRGVRCLDFADSVVQNYSYFPISVGPEYAIDRDGLFSELGNIGVNARRYFYPLLSSFSMYRELPSAAHENLLQAAAAAKQVLCLPIYPGLEASTIDQISELIRGQ